MVRLRQRGTMRAGPGDRWQRFIADQAIGFYAPGFVWLARVRVLPLVSVNVLDAYIGGTGVLEARVLGSVKVAQAVGPQVNRGELMRYLAELAWAPHAMLCNSHSVWRQLGGAAVEMSVPNSAGPGRVRLLFRDGELAEVEADDRPKTIGRRTVPTRWPGRFDAYCIIAGVRIPARAEVSWEPEDGAFAGWRGEVTGYRPG